VELRLASVRIGHFDRTLGSGGDGPIYTSHRRAWRSPWHHGRRLRRAECSNERSTGKASQSTSAPIMIRCIDSIGSSSSEEVLESRM
jgi:hypothetical protein